jgi:hypothetical protein
MTTQAFQWHPDRASTRVIPLGYRDAKGRRIGAHVTIVPGVVVTEGGSIRRSDMPILAQLTEGTEVLRVSVQPTRNERDFGASVDGKIVLSSEAAEAEVTRRVDAMRKRYAKLADESNLT